MLCSVLGLGGGDHLVGGEAGIRSRGQGQGGKGRWKDQMGECEIASQRDFPQATFGEIGRSSWEGIRKNVTKYLGGGGGGKGDAGGNIEGGPGRREGL